MSIDWVLVTTALLAGVNAMLVGAVIVWTLIEWGAL